MRKTFLLLALLTLGACTEEVPKPTEGTGAPPGFGDEFRLSDTERAECMARGGKVERGAESPAEYCVLPLKDAGKACRKASDCESACLAETRTCAPVKPLFGCYSVLEENGQPAMLCVE